MPGTLILQASTDRDLSEETTDRIRAELEDVMADYDEFEDVRSYYQEKKDVTTYGFSVKTNLEELANNPGNGRYLGMFICGEDGIISEKFISNPAIKHDKGRTNLAFSVLQQNGVDQLLLREPATEEQEAILGEIELPHRQAPVSDLDELREEFS